MVGDILDVIKFEENIIRFEDFLQVRVTKLCHQVNFIKVLWCLIFWQNYFNHTHDIGMFAIFKQHYFTQNSPCFRSRLKQLDNFLDSDIRICRFSYSLCNISVRAFADDFLDFVPISEVFLREDFIDISSDFFPLDKFGALLFVLHE